MDLEFTRMPSMRTIEVKGHLIAYMKKAVPSCAFAISIEGMPQSYKIAEKDWNII